MWDWTKIKKKIDQPIYLTSQDFKYYFQIDVTYGVFYIPKLVRKILNKKNITSDDVQILYKLYFELERCLGKVSKHNFNDGYDTIIQLNQFLTEIQHNDINFDSSDSDSDSEEYYNF